MLADQVFVVTALYNLTVIQYDDCIAVADSGESMGDYEYGTAFHQVIHTFLYDALCTGIDTGGCFIQDQYRWVGYCCPGNRQKLSLSLGQFFAVSA